MFQQRLRYREIQQKLKIEKSMQEKGSIQIQSWWRSAILRREFGEIRASVIILQSMFRGVICRESIRKRKPDAQVAETLISSLFPAQIHQSSAIQKAGAAHIEERRRQEAPRSTPADDEVVDVKYERYHASINMDEWRSAALLNDAEVAYRVCNSPDRVSADRVNVSSEIAPKAAAVALATSLVAVVMYAGLLR